MDFSEKVVLVTGAGSGIGRGVALYMAALSAKLSLADVDANSLDDTAKQCGNNDLFTMPTDLAQDQEVKKLIEETIKHFGKLDVVVNCAGIFKPDTLQSENLLENFDKTVAVNLKGTIAVCHYAAEALVETKGCIINISSMSSIKVVKYTLSYLTTKAALDHFSRAIAIQLAPKGVRVNCILPGVVRTNLNKHAMTPEAMEEYYRGAVERVPMKHVISPEEIGKVVAFLASDLAGSITGVCLPVDCGYSCIAPPLDLTLILNKTH